MARMKVFNSLEEAEFESPPKFNSAERKQFFSRSQRLNELLKSLRTPTNKVCFLILIGYFKARRKFFAQQFIQTDIEFVAHQIDINPSDVSVENYSKGTYARHQQLILLHFGYSEFDAFAHTIVTNEINTLVRVQCRPKLILLDIIQVLIRKKFAVPHYNLLADLVVTGINQYQQMLGETIIKSLDDHQRIKLDNLLKKELNADGDSGWRYKLTLFKNTYQSTQPSKIKANLSDLKALQVLYLELKPVIGSLGLNSESIRHYAYLVIKSQIPQVSRRSDEVRYLYLIAFIAFQTFKLNDILVDTLLNSVQSVTNLAQKQQKESYFKEREQRNQSFSEQVSQLQSNIDETLLAIRQILDDGKLNNTQKVASIDDALNIEKSKLNAEELNQSAIKIQNGQDYLESLETHSLKLQRRVSDIIRQIQFAENSSNSALLKALQYYKTNNSNLDKNAPTDFLSSEEAEILNAPEGKFRISLYKALLFVKTAKSIKSGALNLIHSEKYRSLDDYLIPKLEWEKHRTEYLERANLNDFSDCKTTLGSLDSALDERYQQINQNFKSGNNPYLTIRANGTVHVKTPKQEEIECLSLGNFFPERKYISMIEMLATVNQVTNFIEEFEHWQIKYQRTKPALKTFFAGIIGYGCDIGHRKLAQISSQINENELENGVNWYFSLQNIQNANDRILEFINQMDLPKIYQPESEPLHTSSDGQKIEVNVDSLNANYSFKYCGKNKGVSVITFIDMRDLMWYSTVISAAEREAAYVIDGLMHNDVIKSDIHSTDTHGYWG